MSSQFETPNLKYAISEATCCGRGNQNEFDGMATMSHWDRTELNEKLWDFSPEDKANPEHGVGHESLICASSIFPQTEEMKRIISAPRYQGDMQLEFFVLGVQFALEEIFVEKRLNPDIDFSFEDIKDLIEDKAMFAYGTSGNVERGNAGNRGAFYLGMTSDPKKSVFQVRLRTH